MKKHDRDKIATQYGIYKFRLPSPEEISSALNISGEQSLFKKIVTHNMYKFYRIITPPENNDWLIDHKEYGQTYNEYINKQYYPLTNYRDTIYICPISYGDNASIDPSFVDYLLVLCQNYFYGVNVRLLPEIIDLNKYNIDVRIYKNTNKIQINASDVITILRKKLPRDAYCLIAFTDQDLYNLGVIIKPRDYYEDNEENENEEDEYKENERKERKVTLNSFCYGLSSVKSRVSIVSFSRYDPLFYINDDSINSENKLMNFYFILLKRACKVMIKEVSHMFGLINCIYFKCIMNGFNSMEEFDKRPIECCPVCIRKLYTNICLKGSPELQNKRVLSPLILFDRLVKLADAIKEHLLNIFEKEMKWYERRINDLSEEL